MFILYSVLFPSSNSKQQFLPFELSDEVLGQGLSEALSSDAVVSMGVENPEYSSVDLQHCNSEGRSTQFIHQHVAVNKNRSRKVNCLELNYFDDIMGCCTCS